MTGIYSNAYGAAYTQNGNADLNAMAPLPPIIAANQSASIWGDPHINAANGGKYDFQNAGIFNLLSDSGINLNAQITQKPGDSVAFDTQAGLAIGGDTLQFDADGKLMISYNGNTAVQAKLEDGKSYTLGQNGSIIQSGDSYIVDSPEYTVNVDTNKDDNGLKYLNLKVSSGQNGVVNDGIAPTGLLGETFNPSQAAQTAPMDVVDNYRAPDLFSQSTHATQSEAAAAAAQVPAPSPVDYSALLQPTTATPQQYADPYSYSGQDATQSYGDVASPSTYPTTDPTAYYNAAQYPSASTSTDPYGYYSQASSQPYGDVVSPSQPVQQYAPVDSTAAYAQPATTDASTSQTSTQDPTAYLGMLMQVLLQSVQALMQLFQSGGAIQ